MKPRMEKVHGPYSHGSRWRIVRVDVEGIEGAKRTVSFPTRDAALAGMVVARNEAGNWRRSASRSVRRDQRLRMVYFVQAASGPIKIGATVDIGTRILELQVSQWERLSLLGIFHAKERDVHDQFAHLRLRGEWFRPEQDLLDFIAANASGPSAASSASP